MTHGSSQRLYSGEAAALQPSSVTSKDLKIDSKLLVTTSLPILALMPATTGSGAVSHMHHQLRQHCQQPRSSQPPRHPRSTPARTHQGVSSSVKCTSSMLPSSRSSSWKCHGCNWHKHVKPNALKVPQMHQGWHLPRRSWHQYGIWCTVGCQRTHSLHIQSSMCSLTCTAICMHTRALNALPRLACDPAGPPAAWPPH